MSEQLQSVYLVRHGETAWSVSGQHTGLTDLPLTERGEQNALRLRGRLAGIPFARVFRSPLQRASRTCALAGFGARAEDDPELVEWNYGAYEGLRTAEIHAQRPDWQLFRDGCPGGESPSQVAARAESVLARVRAGGGNALIFSSGHFSRMLAMRWLGLEPAAGRFFMLDPASVSVLGFETSVAAPVVRLWNDTSHLTGHPAASGPIQFGPKESSTKEVL
jgi:probable phosphoglycerate mutase